MKIPQISGLEVIKRLKRIGFVVTRQKGSHIRLERYANEETIKLTVPLHKEMKKGTLHQVLKQAGISLEEFDEIK